ncbi:MAG: L,D-transpeptidase [Gammaproteobacteria bacterium]
MRQLLLLFRYILSGVVFSLLASCASMNSDYQQQSSTQSQNRYAPVRTPHIAADYSNRLPQHLDTQGNKMVLVDPNVHAWGAYGSDGNLIKAGIATAGDSSCPPDTDERDCRTNSGTFHITSLGDEGCYSKKYPRPNGGGLMPYCMFFNNGQALHGSPDDIVVEDNVSHGCVRMRIPDSEWMRTQFAQVGTRVVVVPYSS